MQSTPPADAQAPHCSRLDCAKRKTRQRPFWSRQEKPENATRTCVSTHSNPFELEMAQAVCEAGQRPPRPWVRERRARAAPEGAGPAATQTSLVQVRPDRQNCDRKLVSSSKQAQVQEAKERDAQTRGRRSSRRRELRGSRSCQSGCCSSLAREVSDAFLDDDERRPRTRVAELVKDGVVLRVRELRGALGVVLAESTCQHSRNAPTLYNQRSRSPGRTLRVHRKSVQQWAGSRRSCSRGSQDSWCRRQRSPE